MCLFPKKVPYNSPAYKYGMTEFGCGVCPECLAQRARPWALRCAYEAREQPAMMICLTYDSYVYDRHGRVVGERVAKDMQVNKRDVQLFIKRLRKAYSSSKIKYLVAAEYGKKTHRPHYHAIIFGILFDDLIFYKKSKRGSILYKSATLTKIWGNGICTVDGVNINVACARYCTKYAMKDKNADTFMLFSRNIGTKGLLRDFNGKSYYLDGKEYPIPKLIWRDYLCQKYNIPIPRYRSFGWCMSKYGDLVRFDNKLFYLDKSNNLRFCNKVSINFGEKLYDWYLLGRERFQSIRDNDFEYKAYLRYWREKADLNPYSKLSAFERVVLLDDSKYHFYKQKALQALHIRSLGLPAIVPRSNSLTEIYKLKEAVFPQRTRFDNNPYRDILRHNLSLRSKCDELISHLPLPSRPLTANDTHFTEVKQFFDENGVISDFALEYCKNLHVKMRKKIKFRINLEETPFN